MKYRNILLDADGTLLDFSKSEKESLFEALVLSGMTPLEEHLKVYSRINDGLWKMLERGEIERNVLTYKRFELLGEHFGFQLDAKKIAGDYMNALSQRGDMLDGAEEFLKALKNKKYNIYIVTNGVEPVQSKRLAASLIPRYAKDIFISGAIGYEKPDVRYFEYVAEHIEGFDKKTALIVGDSLTSDIRGGINFGIDTCWYNPCDTTVPKDINITYVVNKLDKIFDIISEDDGI